MLTFARKQGNGRTVRFGIDAVTRLHCLALALAVCGLVLMLLPPRVTAGPSPQTSSSCIYRNGVCAP